jgi:hypothetical protein
MGIVISFAAPEHNAADTRWVRDLQPEAPPVKFHEARCNAGHDHRGEVAV